MAFRAVFTDNGREFMARFNARYTEWCDWGYRMFYDARWGEGGYETVSGVLVPKDPSAFASANNLQVVLDAPSYPDFNAYSTPPGTILIDQFTEIFYLGGGNRTMRVRGHLDTGDENDDGTGNSPHFFECGIFDNAYDILQVRAETGVTANNLMLYGTFDEVVKTITRQHDVDFDTNFK